MFYCLSLSLIENPSFPLIKWNKIEAPGNSQGPPWQPPSVPPPLLPAPIPGKRRAPATADLPLCATCPPIAPGTSLHAFFSLAHTFSLFSTSIIHQYLNMFLVPWFRLTSLFSFPSSLPSQPRFLKELSTGAVCTARLPLQSSIPRWLLCPRSIDRRPRQKSGKRATSRTVDASSA